MLAPQNVGKKTFTKVIEREGTLVVSRKPLHIITRSCKHYGSDFETTLNTSKLLFGDNRRKSPILLANSYGVPYIFIPTLSPLSNQNVWIAYHSIDFFKKDGLGTTIFLDNGQSFKTEVSAPTIYRQYALARLIEKDFLKKRQLLNRSFFSQPVTDGPYGFPNL